MNKIYKSSKNNKTFLPISCLCSIYINTSLEEISLALKSILIQKMLPSQIVIVIDGPVSNSIIKFFNHLITEYPHLKIVRNKENKGLGLSLNKGLKLCDYDIVARFDADDINLEDRLAIQYNYLTKNKNLDILGTYIKEFKFIKKNKFSRVKKVPQSDAAIKSFINLRNPINHPSIMFRKNAILRSGSYLSMHFFEDYYLWLRCKSNNCTFFNLDLPLVAMKRISNLERRHGFGYAFYELKFIFLCFTKKLIPLSNFLILLLRVLIRISPNFLSNLFYKYDKQRSDFIKDENLTTYIYQLKEFKFKYEI